MKVFSTVPAGATPGKQVLNKCLVVVVFNIVNTAVPEKQHCGSAKENHFVKM